MMTLRCLAGALALVLMPLAAGAAETPCATRIQVMAVLAQKLPQARVTVLAAGDAKLFMTSLNRIPPSTALNADEVMIVDTGGNVPALRVMLFENGCLSRMGNMPRPIVRQILNDVARGRA